jgi:hypothetical protein
MGWYIERIGDRVVASVPTGRWDTGRLSFAISREEFERLKAGTEAFRDIFNRHNEVRGEGWVAQREETCIVFLEPERFADSRRFRIPDEAFERLRGDPGLFDDIYRAHHTDCV